MAKLDSDVIGAYIDALQDLTEIQIKHAFKRAVKSWQPAYGRNFPSPAELREYAKELDGKPVETQTAPTEINPEKLPKGWSMEDWKRAKLTLQVARANASRPEFEAEGVSSETRKEYAARIIAKMRAAIASGANSFPGTK